MKIRAWRKVDTAVLRQIHAIINPDQPLPSTRHLWLIEDGGKVVGYTAVTPVPGLDSIYELSGGILPTHRRQGLGSHLLQHVLHEAPALNIGQLSHCVTDRNSPAAHFLRRHNFFIEHEEWLMRLSLLPQATFGRRPPAPWPSCYLRTLDSPARLFRRLYDQSFSGTPWYQPYSEEEVENILDDPDDILFLFQDEQPIGFAWLQGEAIEPIGIVK
ncbi:MAG: GNAT family N-acetyltransferase, partial [Anaerolineae bacterium]